MLTKSEFAVVAGKPSANQNAGMNRTANESL